MSVHAKTRQQTEVQPDLLSDSEVQNRSGTGVIDGIAVTVATACWLDSWFAERQAVLGPTEDPVHWCWSHFPWRPRKLEREVYNSSTHLFSVPNGANTLRLYGHHPMFVYARF